MSGLAISQAPPPSRPLRFLLTATLWGVVAGGWLAWCGDLALTSRWATPSVALVHLFTLGVLGNAMLGSLLQFLPVAAASPLALGRGTFWLHGIYNLGVAALVFGLAQLHPPSLMIASALLAASLLAFAFLAWRALARGQGDATLRTGIARAILSLAATVALGAVLVGIVLGLFPAPADRVADVHAATGLFGWTFVLMVAVGSVTMPMFQGAATVASRWIKAWMLLAASGLLVGAILRVMGHTTALAIGIGMPALLAVLASLWLQWRIRHRRNPALTAFWFSGSLSVGAGACLLLASVALQVDTAMLVGVLVIAVGLPLMLLGMLLEIVSFLAWIHLRRQCPRGRRVPGVDRLLPERDKLALLAMHLLASAGLLAALHWPALSSAAGVTLVCAYAATASAVLRCHHRADRFIALTAETAPA